MRRVDFFLSNDRHHVAMTVPVGREIEGGYGLHARVISLCELRGIRTPTERLAASGLEVVRVVPRDLRASPASGAAPTSGRPSLVRRAARAAAWHAVLRPRLSRLLSSLPALAVLPNDSAYPYDHITDWLTTHDVPFLLLQEGVRFPLPGAEEARRYGAGGAIAVAAWGEASAEYFRQVGVPPDRIHLTGSPRHDRSGDGNDGATAPGFSARFGAEGRALLLATNPIDDQGFCTTASKHALVERFLTGLRPLLVADGLTLLIKPQARESGIAYGRSVTAARIDGHTRIVTDAPLEPLLARVEGVVILASTVGLEALRAGRPLGVLEIPGFGFVHDYVSSGAAVGLGWDRPMHEQVAQLLREDVTTAARALAYLRCHLAVGEGASRRVAQLIVDLAGADRVG